MSTFSQVFSDNPARRLTPLAVFCGIFGMLVGCQSFRVPPAQQPQQVSTGLQVTGATGTTTIGELNAYCNDFTLSPGPNGRVFYVTIQMPTLNHPEVTYAGVLSDFWGALTDPVQQALSQGPRPITPQQTQDLQGNYVGYFIHDDFLTGNDYHVVLGILLGQGVSENGVLQIRSTNTDPQNTGLQARSNPLEIPITGPVRLTTSLSPTTVQESQSLTVSWNADNADRVEISGPGFAGGTALPVSGSRSVTAECTGDRDSSSTSYQVKALRAGCPTPRMATRSLSATVNTPRAVTMFEGIPIRPNEGSTMTLRWDTTGAAGVMLTGPNSFSHSATGSQGQTAATTPSVAQCLSLENFNYRLTANWPACGPRTATALVSATTVTGTFDLVETGGTQCLSSHVCRVAARSLTEARNCARCSIQQGCTWQ